MAYARCPLCTDWVQILGDPELGISVICHSCGNLLRLVELDPIRLDHVYIFYEVGPWRGGELVTEEGNAGYNDSSNGRPCPLLDPGGG